MNDQIKINKTQARNNYVSQNSEKVHDQVMTYYE